MPTVREIEQCLSFHAPRELSESWDNDGVMLCRTPDKPVQKALIMLEVRESGAAYAVKGGYDLIITHHPLIFRPLKQLVGNDYALMHTLMCADIPVLSFHTRLDSAKEGVNAIAAERLGLEEVECFGGENGTLGRIGLLPRDMTAEEFTDHVKAAFHVPALRASFFEDENRKIRRVGIVGGGGKHEWRDALAKGADAFVTSEISHDVFIDAKAAGIAVVDAGHYYTENPVCARIAEFLARDFGTSFATDIFDVGSPYLDI